MNSTSFVFVNMMSLSFLIQLIMMCITRGPRDTSLILGVTNCDTQVFIWIFQKILFDLRGVIQNFSSRELSLSYIFFMAKVLFGITQDLPLALGVLAFHLGSRQNVFHLGKITFENLFEFCTMAFGKSFATFNNSFLPWH